MRSWPRHLILPALLVLAFAAVSCSRDRPAARQAAGEVYPVRGVVRGPYAAGSITIEHEPVPNYMPAMTMPFNVEQADVQSLAPGDRVEFELHVNGDVSRATNFRRTGRVAGATSPDAAPVRAVRLRPGDEVPGFALVDQDEHPFTRESLQGRRSVVTFVFTRCPVPEFCPLLARKFQALQSALAERRDVADVQLVSITIDPEHDRPAVLRAYGEAQQADFSRWRFVTGESGVIADLARRFAVRTERNGATLDHTLATALVGPDGRIIEIWRGNAWQPEEVLTALSRGSGERQ